MKNTFGELISKLDKAEERVSELEGRSETCQLKKRKEKNRISKNCGMVMKSVAYAIMRIPGEERME